MRYHPGQLLGACLEDVDARFLLLHRSVDGLVCGLESQIPQEGDRSDRFSRAVESGGGGHRHRYAHSIARACERYPVLRSHKIFEPLLQLALEKRSVVRIGNEAHQRLTDEVAVADDLLHRGIDVGNRKRAVYPDDAQWHQVECSLVPCSRIEMRDHLPSLASDVP
jgi:hypothetical protein